MSDSMIGRVARAIFDAANGDKSWTYEDERAVGADWEKEARAAIKAMREPTADMIAHGESYMDFVLPEGFDNTVEGRRAEFKMGFVCAIDSALEAR